MGASITHEHVELSADQLDMVRAGEIHDANGGLALRSIIVSIAAALREEMQQIIDQAPAMQLRAKPHPIHANARVTPNGTLCNDDLAPRTPWLADDAWLMIRRLRRFS